MPVLGPRAMRGRDVNIFHSEAAKPDAAASATSGAVDDRSFSGEPPSVPDTSAPDVGAQSAATLATLESDRAAMGMTTVQVQQIARLAVAAYGL
jgi:hypothetical protein